MTTHEKTRLIELLTSGDEQNILMAKEICEQQNRIDIISDADYKLRKSNNYAIFLKTIFGLKKKTDFDYSKDGLVFWINGDACLKMSQYLHSRTLAKFGINL